MPITDRAAPSVAPVFPPAVTVFAAPQLNPQLALQWVLRFGAFFCFVGHGAFGIITKSAWVPYFAVAHVGHVGAYEWMPLIGTLDITLGVLILLRPRPAILYWMVAWALWTALLRPLAHESGWEFFERAGNYGVPLALLCLVAPARNFVDQFRTAHMRDLSSATLRRTRFVLVASVALLLIGHGALGVIHKPGLTTNYASILPGAAASLTPIIGWIEIGAAIAIVALPSIPLALGIGVWKLATESLFLLAGAPVWEVVERGGSYAAPVALALILLLERRAARR